LSTGGTSDEAFNDNDTSSISRRAAAGCEQQHHGSSSILVNGLCNEVEEGDDEDDDEDDFLQLIFQVSTQDCELSNSDDSNFIGNTTTTTSTTTTTIMTASRLADNNNMELFDFILKDGEHMVLSWKAAKYFTHLYVNVPGGLLPAGSRECFVSLLEYAEEILKVDTMFLCMNKDRPDRANLLRIFMFLGFEIVHCTSCPLVPKSDKYLFMCYSFD